MPRSRVAVSSVCKGAAARPQTFLARPFIPLDVAKSGVLWNLRDQVQPEPSWTTSASFLRHIEGADEFFRRSIAAHPVLVRQSLHRLQQGHGIPTVARASKTPGRTRQLFTFEVGRDEHLKEGKGRPLRIVDLPGLGFAKGIDAEQKAEWRALVGEYMERADNLRLVVSLIDVIEGVKSTDEYLWKLITRSMENRNVLEEGPPPPRLMVVLTKVDRVKATTLHEEVSSILSRIEYWQQEFNATFRSDYYQRLVHHELSPPLGGGSRVTIRGNRLHNSARPNSSDLRRKLSFWPYVHCVSAQDGHGMPELRAALVEAMDRRYWKKKKAKPN
ncbi:hypothetical protein FOZ62_030981 [Perkinsus olseni]|uniref:G domain-containing protein n=1 Tax=Perkinsus olseni TaxID=32597 RepID=A0A7J6QK99_PEROL|nr:hypothetical protein FOZ62_030981 [Perkinsus olseni]